MKSISTDRLVPALLAALVSGWSGAQTVNVVEYRNKALDAYFITGRASEKRCSIRSLIFRARG